MMLNLRALTGRVSAAWRRVIGADPLSRPLGRVPDGTIDAALAARGRSRADLFTPKSAFARHRERLAVMLAAQGHSPGELAATRWPELKDADHRCAHCPNARRCKRWLRRGRRKDAPRMFCPNVLTFERIEVRAKLSGPDEGGQPR